MELTFDPAKRALTLKQRGLDFADAGQAFAGPRFTIEDKRKDYGETRYATLGLLQGRVVMVVWTPRRTIEGDEARHIISMRKANAREQALFKKALD